MAGERLAKFVRLLATAKVEANRVERRAPMPDAKRFVWLVWIFPGWKASPMLAGCFDSEEKAGNYLAGADGRIERIEVL